MRYALLVLTVSAPWLPTGAHAQASRLELESLMVLPGLYVEVNGVTPEALEDGLSPDSIRTDIAAALRSHGIPILTQPEWQTTIGNPAIHVVFDLLKLSSRQYIYRVTLEVRQLTRLMRDSTKMVFTRTWASDNLLGAVRTANLPSLRQEVRPLLQQFISDYLEAKGRARRASAAGRARRGAMARFVTPAHEAGAQAATRSAGPGVNRGSQTCRAARRLVGIACRGYDGGGNRSEGPREDT